MIPAEIGVPQAGAQDPQIEHRIRLRHWIHPIPVEASRVSLHVIEAGDAAGALVEFAGRNNVDLIVLGAPAPGERALAWWRSVASSVTANASCSVHVVRRPVEVSATPSLPPAASHPRDLRSPRTPGSRTSAAFPG